MFYVVDLFYLQIVFLGGKKERGQRFLSPYMPGTSECFTNINSINPQTPL